MELSQELKTRLKTAGILIIVLLALLVAATFSLIMQKTMVIVALLIAVIISYEFASVLSEKIFSIKKIISFIAAFLPTLIFFLILVDKYQFHMGAESAGIMNYALKCLLPSIFIVLFYSLISGRNQLSNITDYLPNAFIAIFYIGLGGLSLLFLAAHENASLYIIWLLLVVCLNDAAAYLFGSKIGGPKLAPAISPNKTISGSVAGLLIGVLAGVCFTWLLPTDYTVSYIALIALAVTLAAQAGDLIESYFKRIHNVKDVSNLLPGHGGLLDRIDAILLAAIALAVLIL